jgi:hypothetical protein
MFEQRHSSESTACLALQLRRLSLCVDHGRSSLAQPEIPHQFSTFTKSEALQVGQFAAMVAADISRVDFAHHEVLVLSANRQSQLRPYKQAYVGAPTTACTCLHECC